ncbi:hypothetical protein N7489_003006 [Penicillium chrysogenum]|uniref:Stc1 domain-containing protein n=1 Tax=Penicillium chrysogenum TaxID=5076 RepID=A0ABQ8W7K1_PENCH|nr:uncharacterized protein N7489_003006 [Penicillium chrysogenum]KAJ5252596.1 hypothetical protein N7489_003006 [Penicillium chrysogenum]KAJ5259836.1 hypothetical protein N7505_009217 [Penicillium chrysogenum]KAJ6142298.1 hypothetical protein N7497_011397 [Penicillium chrysogenum]
MSHCNHASQTQKRRWEKEDTLPRKRACQTCEACEARKTNEELPELTVESISGYQERMNDDPPAHVSPDGHDRDADPNDTVSAPNTRGA